VETNEPRWDATGESMGESRPPSYRLPPFEESSGEHWPTIAAAELHRHLRRRVRDRVRLLLEPIRSPTLTLTPAST